MVASAARMRISTSIANNGLEPEEGTVECLLRVGDEVVPQVEEFKYLRILFTNEGLLTLINVSTLGC